jgi:hypothetical protein
MKKLFNLLHGDCLRTSASRHLKFLLALGMSLLGLGARAAESPRGRQVFASPRPMAATTSAPPLTSTSTTAAAVVPPPRTVQLVWSYPIALQTPDLIFKLYHSTNLLLPMRQWKLVTNVPGTARNVRVPADKLMDFFALTASNYLGESKFATR